MSKVQIIVSSCSRRSLEIEQMKDFFEGNGYSVSDDNWNIDTNADYILLNTCAFTKAAEDFGIETLRKIQNKIKPTAKVIVCGCMPEINKERLTEEFDGEFFGPRSYENLNEIFKPEKKFQEFRRPNTLKKSLLCKLKDDIDKTADVIKTFDGSLSGLVYVAKQLSNGMSKRLIQKIANIESSKIFYIQIQEGCPMHCAYCVIRLAIGGLKSRGISEIIEEFQEGLNQGYKNFQLLGDCAGAYGLDIGVNLGILLNEFLKFDKEFKLDITDISPKYLQLMKDPLMKLCRMNKISSFYIPIQSGSPRILELMGRQCDVDKLKQDLTDIRNSSDKFAFGTSVIVGFPSETQEELEETIAFCKDVGFNWVWCHSFSARPETKAAEMPNQINEQEILNRSEYFKSVLKEKVLVTNAQDTAGSKTCQG